MILRLRSSVPIRTDNASTTSETKKIRNGKFIGSPWADCKGPDEHALRFENNNLPGTNTIGNRRC